MSIEATAELIKQADSFLDAGRLQEAKQLFSKVCELDNNHAEAWTMVGVISGELGNIDDAEQCLRKSIEVDVNYADAHYFMATILVQKSNFEQAYQFCQKAVDLDAGFTEAKGLLSTLTTKLSKNSGDTVEGYQQYIKKGKVFYEQGNHAEALKNLRAALDIDSSLIDAWRMCGEIYMQIRQFDEAINVYKKILSLDADYTLAANNLGQIYLFQKNDLNTAIQYFEQAINIDASYAPAHENLAAALFYQGRMAEAISSIRKAVHFEPAKVGYLANLAVFLRCSGQFDEAIVTLDKVITIEPENIEALAGKADVLQRQQNFTQAYEIIRGLLDKGIRSPNIAIVLADVCRKFDACDEAIDLICEILADDNPPDEVRRQLHYSLGKLYDAKNEYALAFEQYRFANEFENSPFYFKRQSTFIDELIDTYSDGFEQRIPASNVDTQRPIFIVGMPRSGTSLVEQILASHPDVYGAGELAFIGHQTLQLAGQLDTDMTYPSCMTVLSQQAADKLAKDYLDHLADINPTASKITDKMPQNFLHIGFIRRVFPQAKIIHCKRNILDTCLSIYFQSFGEMLPYSSNLENIASFYANYARLMKHWDKVLPGNQFMEIQYEELVDDLELNSRKLLDYCGLEWHDSCLEFYKTGRSVATASYHQVRQPVYKKSVNRWKHYRQQLQPLVEELQKHGIDVDTD